MNCLEVAEITLRQRQGRLDCGPVSIGAAPRMAIAMSIGTAGGREQAIDSLVHCYERETAKSPYIRNFPKLYRDMQDWYP